MEARPDEYHPLFGSQGALPDRPLFGVSNRTLILSSSCWGIVERKLVNKKGIIMSANNITKGEEHKSVDEGRSESKEHRVVVEVDKHAHKDRVVNLVLGSITGLLFVISLISSFFAHRPPHGLNIYFGICICLILISHIVLIYWYRQGDLDPKFRLLIYYNAVGMITLTTCALAYFFVDENVK